MQNFQLLEIVFFAMVAGLVLFRLFQVLGRRTGEERPPPESANARFQADNVTKLADHREVREAPQLAERPTDPLQNALFEIKLADRNFDVDHFVKGARAAYEMIVTGFAAGDRATLKPLLSDEVYGAFDQGIKAREAAGQKVDFTFVGFKDAHVSHAELKGRNAEVTVSFAAQFISATLSKDGAVVEGDTKTVHDVTDVWTFARDVRGRDPNWTLVATSGHAA